MKLFNLISLKTGKHDGPCDAGYLSMFPNKNGTVDVDGELFRIAPWPADGFARLSGRGRTQHLSAAASVGLTQLELDYAARVPYTRSAASVIDMAWLDQMEARYRSEDEVEIRAEKRRERQLACFRRLSHLSRFIMPIARECQHTAQRLNRAVANGWQDLDPAEGEQIENACRLCLNTTGVAW